MEAEKPKRQLTEEQLENLRKGREKRAESKQKNKTITTYKKEQQKIKNEKRDKEYNDVIELKKKKEAKEEEIKEEVKSTPKPKPKSKPKAKPPPPPPPDEVSEEEEEEVEYEPPPRKIKQQPPPPPKQITRKQRPAKREPTDSEITENANIEMLRKRYIEQRNNRLINDLFNY
jgi:hypothetical protein